MMDNVVTAWEESHGFGQAVIPSREWFGSKIGMARLELRLLLSREEIDSVTA